MQSTRTPQCIKGLRHPIWIALIFLIFAWTATQTVAQQARTTHQIQGKVTDAGTGEPLHFANVFLSGTTLGAATDPDGEFIIYSVLTGDYELVVSMIGYDTEIRAVSIPQENQRPLNVRLKSKPIEAPGVAVSAVYPRRWDENLNYFKSLFLGMTPNAKACTIENPEVLDFIYNRAAQRFSARASAPLRIVNRALGYQITLILEEFNAVGWSVRSLFRTQFSPLPPQNNEEKQRWETARLMAYRGSLTHFMEALVQDRLKDEGYSVFRVKAISDIKSEPFTDQASDSLLSLVSNSQKRLFSFKDLLKVIYSREGEDPEYILQRGGWKTGEQVSWLQLRTGAALVDTAGHLGTPYDVTTHGYMTWERFAEFLPVDYTPPSDVKLYAFTPIPWQLAPLDAALETRNLQASYNLSDPLDLIQRARGTLSPDRTEEITNLFYAALSRLGIHEMADSMFHETAVVMDDDEQKAYRDAENKGEALLFYWQKHDPTPATRANERLLEHWTRVKNAKEWYPALNDRGYDDRGETYIRYGAPNQFLESDADGFIQPCATWVYHLFGDETVFDFLLNTFEYVKTFKPKDILAQKDGDLVAAIKTYVGQRVAISSQYSTAAQELSKYGLDFNGTNDLVPETAEREVIKITKFLLEENRAGQKEMPPYVGETVRTEMPLAATATLTRSGAGDSARVDITWAVPLRSDGLDFDTSNDGTVTLHIAYAIHDEHAGLVMQNQIIRKLRPDVTSAPQRCVIIDGLSRSLPSGEYTVSLELSNPTSGRTYRTSFQTAIPEKSETGLTISQPALAYRARRETASSPALTRRALAVVPYPSSRIKRTEPVNVVFEIDGLKLNTSGRFNYTVSWSLKPTDAGFFAKLNPFRKKTSASAAFRRTSSDVDIADEFRLEIHNVDPGEYMLNVEVTDQNTRASDTTTLRLTVDP